MRLFACGLAVRKVFFLKSKGVRKDWKSRVGLVRNDMYVISVVCKIKLHNFERVLLDIQAIQLAQKL